MHRAKDTRACREAGIHFPTPRGERNEEKSGGLDHSHAQRETHTGSSFERLHERGLRWRWMEWQDARSEVGHIVGAGESALGSASHSMYCTTQAKAAWNWRCGRYLVQL